jgi:hypothetical protein
MIVAFQIQIEVDPSAETPFRRAPSQSTLLVCVAGLVPGAGQRRYSGWKAIGDKAGMN